MGTKFKIEEYINEVLNCLDYLNEALNNDNNDEYIMNSKQLKLDFSMMQDNHLVVVHYYYKVDHYLDYVI